MEFSSISRLVLAVPASCCLLAISGCKNNQNTAATLPAAPAASYPQSDSSAGGGSDSSLVAIPNNSAPEQRSKPKPAPRKPEPFELQEGETLVNHTVVSGDNLTKLAKRYDTTIRRIQSANGLTGDKIYTGKVYKIPTRQGLASRPPLPAPSVASTPPSPPTTPRPSSNPAPSFPQTPPRSSSSSTVERPTFTPREFDFDASPPTQPAVPIIITPPTQSASSAGTVPSSSGGGAAFPAPSFGEGGSY